MDFQEEEIDLLKKSSKRKTAADLTSSSPNAKKRRTENLVNESDVTELPTVPEEREDLESVEANHSIVTVDYLKKLIILLGVKHNSYLKV